MRKAKSGFTIVELLIVIVVIAILATISIVAYNGIQERAIASTVKSDLANFAKKIEIAKATASDSAYPTIPTQSMGIKASKNAYKSGRYNWYYCASPDRTSYALGVIDVKDRGYYQSSIGGIQENIVNPTSITTCDLVGGTWAGAEGYWWNSSTNTGGWQSWVN